MYRYAAAMLVLMLVAGSGALAPSAVAQSSWETAPSDRPDDPARYDTPGTPDPAGTGVPDWADSGTNDSAWGSNGPVEFGPEMNNSPNPPGSDIPQVPVDGGLSLLALAGAGYAARRLRRDRDEDEPTHAL